MRWHLNAYFFAWTSSDWSKYSMPTRPSTDPSAYPVCKARYHTEQVGETSILGGTVLDDLTTMMSCGASRMARVWPGIFWSSSVKCPEWYRMR